ncbi:MAG: glycine--tRNA ligase subunit beta, partial [Proteobacteria bacterium]|nr:glycine--tRNA ligase subunit beta [Pseudomonadota bacterium]
RFHQPGKLQIKKPDEYLTTLEKQGKGIADYAKRHSIILSQVNELAEKNDGKAILNEALLDEVTSLVEWPVCFLGEYDPDFLKLPREVLIASLQDHQRYFPVADMDGNLLPYFICVANIESKKPELIKQGNERVLQPRLNDAVFFWERDIKHGLVKHIPSLKKVVYQKELGTLYDKSQRLIKILSFLSSTSNIDINKAKRAAELCLCDLLTEMVYEFPELQGTMGRYYAEADGEDNDIALALEEFYQPRFAGDELPNSTLGQYLSISEKLDSLVGIFAIGKAPTGDKDPFGLRRSAIGALRIIIECNLDIDLMELIEHCALNYPKKINAMKHINDVYQFLIERLRRYYLDNGISPDTFESVLATNSSKPLDFHERLMAVEEFRKLDAAESLAAANKRIGNIIKKSGVQINNEINTKLLKEGPEINLAESLQKYQNRILPLLDKRDYKTALTQLAGLREDVDNFFDNVLVMCDDQDLMNNRLALLNNLSALFLKTADISKLQG